MHPAIRVDNLSKLYHIGAKQRGDYRTLRESLTDLAVAPWRRWQNLSRRRKTAEPNGQQPQDSFWALKDVSFDVQPGEVVGIIGRNGAGKSTLLKILSRITEPTHGRVEMRGRVASLLEVGTGFHPELTGRENIYLNGTILGMKRREINRKFDAIVDFSGIEQFIDTPVKRYSSGMYVRLAFAVAAHLDPEILIVDEVLAVGDAAFQKKCIRKMGDVASQGRAVLFVSHNLGTVRTFCQTGYLLEKGVVIRHGNVGEVVNSYLKEIGNSDVTFEAHFERPHGAKLWVTRARLLCGDASEGAIETGDDLTLEVFFESESPVSHPKVGFAISSPDGIPLVSANNRYQNSSNLSKPVQAGQFSCQLGAVPLLAGRYAVSIWLGDEYGDSHHIENAVAFDMSDRDIWGNGRLPTRYGFLWWPTQFEISPIQPAANGHDHT